MVTVLFELVFDGQSLDTHALDPGVGAIDVVVELAYRLELHSDSVEAFAAAVVVVCLQYPESNR